MQKKLIAVAVAGALGAPAAALAQESTVQIYGLIIQNITFLDQGGTRLKTDLQNNHDAGVGIRGEEALGGGLSTWFQCESTFDLAGGNATGTLCGRNSAVGLKGGWGTAFVGLWNTPLRDLSFIPLRPIVAPGGGTSEILHNSDALAGNNVTNAGSQFNRRAKNIVQYWSPVWNGFEARAAVTTSNESTAMTSSSTASKPRLWTVAARYVNGPIYLVGGYERHKNYNPTGLGNYRGGDDHMWHIGGAYTFAGVFRLSALWNDLKYETNVGGINDLSAKTWSINGNWQVSGPHRLTAGFSKLQDTSGSLGCPAVAGGPIVPVLVGTWTANCGIGGSGAKYYQAQYGYSFSKRTEVYTTYQKVNNDANSGLRVNVQGAGTASGTARPAIPIGTDQHAWNVGIKHSF